MKTFLLSKQKARNIYAKDRGAYSHSRGAHSRGKGTSIATEGEPYSHGGGGIGQAEALIRIIRGGHAADWGCLYSHPSSCNLAQLHRRCCPHRFTPLRTLLWIYRSSSDLRFAPGGYPEAFWVFLGWRVREADQRRGNRGRESERVRDNEQLGKYG